MSPSNVVIVPLRMTAIKIARQGGRREGRRDAAMQQEGVSRSREDGCDGRRTFFKRGCQPSLILSERAVFGFCMILHYGKDSFVYLKIAQTDTVGGKTTLMNIFGQERPARPHPGWGYGRNRLRRKQAGQKNFCRTCLSQRYPYRSITAAYRTGSASGMKFSATPLMQ
jgi:hypothetical protein